nr:MAG TPA: hypothetical protein [Caudoviricetes sp.]
MTIYTLHSLTFSRLEIHRDSEPIAIMEGKGSFFQRTRQWMAIDNKGNIVTTGRSIYECIKNYADTQGDRSIKEIQCTHGARAAFKTTEEEE